MGSRVTRGRVRLSVHDDSNLEASGEVPGRSNHARVGWVFVIGIPVAWTKVYFDTVRFRI